MNAVSFSTLTTARLTLRQLSINDQQDVLALRSDPEVNKYLGRQPSKTSEDAINFIHKVNENIAKHISLYWAITLTDTKKFAGTICLFDFTGETKSCEIGYELMPEFQRQGIMNEAVKVIVDYTFYNLGLNKILAVTHRHNESSTKLLTKFNFIPSAENDKQHPDLDIYTLTKQNE